MPLAAARVRNRSDPAKSDAVNAPLRSSAHFVDEREAERMACRVGVDGAVGGVWLGGKACGPRQLCPCACSLQVINVKVDVDQRRISRPLRSSVVLDSHELDPPTSALHRGPFVLMNERNLPIREVGVEGRQFRGPRTCDRD